MEIFCSYAHKDQTLFEQLSKHLAPLRQKYPLILWNDTNIVPGSEREPEIQKHLETAQIILLLISPDFMDSNHCYSKEMAHAMERHEQGKARIIPIILRPTDWKDAPFHKLQTLPAGGKPVTDRDWHTTDEAFLNVIEGIRRAVENFVSATEASNINATSLSEAQHLSRSLLPPSPSTTTNAQVLLDTSPAILSSSTHTSSAPGEIRFLSIIESQEVLDSVRKGNIPPAWWISRGTFFNSDFWSMVGVAGLIYVYLFAMGGLVASSRVSPQAEIIMTPPLATYLVIISLIYIFCCLLFGWAGKRSIIVLLPQGLVAYSMGQRNVIPFASIDAITLSKKGDTLTLKEKKSAFSPDDRATRIRISGYKTPADEIALRIKHNYERFVDIMSSEANTDERSLKDGAT